MGLYVALSSPSDPHFALESPMRVAQYGQYMNKYRLYPLSAGLPLHVLSHLSAPQIVLFICMYPEHQHW